MIAFCLVSQLEFDIRSTIIDTDAEDCIFSMETDISCRRHVVFSIYLGIKSVQTSRASSSQFLT